ncbi:DUF433 domain-containing protein [Ralstonia flaminis]|uniref:Uncharacterized protein n=1 Tax=Ralstonia flaminis TaxID=3058597 RepID=A0ABN9JQZ7_9RALS|nr:DUF433 domain-containing protein [Ralstonia sp. LMG 18101]CAJ0821583.1 hypothetical protein LMG18101_04675 [Ralstonia sp. LMG 18101]
MADLTTRQVHSLVRIGALPAALVVGTRNRYFAPLAAVFAAFYFQTHEELTLAARKRAIAVLCERVLERSDCQIFLALNGRLRKTEFDWSVPFGCVTITLKPYVHTAIKHVLQARRALRRIVEDPGILSGTACFKGTRLPIRNALAAVAAGIPFATLHAAYPFLSPSLLDDAAVYVRIRPNAGRERRAAQLFRQLKPVHSKVVRTSKNSQ